MLVCDVVLGDSFVTRQNMEDCTADKLAQLAAEDAEARGGSSSSRRGGSRSSGGNSSTCGYHSLVGEPGDALNYNETVVFQEQAALPRWLIVYTLPVLS